MRILFAGTPDCAVPALKTLAKEFTLCGVLSNPPAPVGRSKKLQDSQVVSAVKELKAEGVLDENLPILTPHKLDDDFREEVKKLQADLLVCFAYGKIFGRKTMSLFPLGGINIHPSLLPQWRGATPVPYAIMSGATETGITIQTIAEKMDAGDILLQKKLEISDKDTTESLLNFCSNECCEILREVLNDFDAKAKTAKKQDDEKATYSSIIKKEDGLIDWSQSAEEIDRKLKAFTPWPGCFTYKNGEKINIIEASPYKSESPCEQVNGDEPESLHANEDCGKILGKDKKHGILVQTGCGVLAISILQKQAKKKLFWKDFLNGSPDFLQGSFSNKNE